MELEDVVLSEIKQPQKDKTTETQCRRWAPGARGGGGERGHRRAKTPTHPQLPPPPPCCVTLRWKPVSSQAVCSSEGGLPQTHSWGRIREKVWLTAASVPGSRADAHGRGVLFIEHALLVAEDLRASYWDLTMTVIVQRRGLGL